MSKNATPTASEEIRSLRSEVKDLEGIRDRLKSENDGMDRSLLSLSHMRMGMYTSLITEREELMARVHRIDARITALGLTDKTRRSGDDYYALNERSSKWEQVL